jgi:L-Ala-D/L-Glu epimerase
MNPFQISGGEVRTFTVSLNDPFITALGRKDATTNVSVRVDTRGGASGVGEASSSLAMASHTPRRLTQALSRLLRRFSGADVRRLVPFASGIWRAAGDTPAAAAAFECAALDAMLQTLRMPMHLWFGGALERIESDFTLSAGPPLKSAQAARRAARAGFRKFKVKVGRGGLREDLGRALAADRCGRRRDRRPELLLDGNQGLDARGALRLVESCLKEGLRVALLEQPLPRTDLRGMARLRRDCPVPIAADESVRSPEDALRVLDMDAADVLNIKVAKSGLRGSLAILALAQAARKDLMIGCMAETAQGLSPSVHLACGTGAFRHVDLDSDVLLGPGQPPGRFRRAGPFLEVI